MKKSVCRSSSSSAMPLVGSRGEEERLHVLVVDDNSVERKFIQVLLNKVPYRVTIVEHGAQALEKLQQANISLSLAPPPPGFKANLILTDYQMPDMTGHELLRTVKQSSAWKEIPVVIMSSDNDPTTINRCLEDGAEDFIRKPLQPSDAYRLRRHMITR